MIGVGVLGAGGMGRAHSKAYRRVHEHFPEYEAKVRLVVVADVIDDRAIALARDFGYERTTTDWMDVIRDPNVEVVSITSSCDMHMEMAIAAAEHGKHIWLEKPSGRHPRETLEIAARATNVISTIGLNYRHAPAVQHARQLITSGELGTVNHFRMRFVNGDAWDPDQESVWQFVRSIAGLGVLGDLGSHAVDLSQFLVGPIAHISAISSVIGDGRENEDWAAALVRFESGLAGTIELSRAASGAGADYEFEIHGTRGAVRWNFERLNELHHYSPLTGGWTLVTMGPDYPPFGRFQVSKGTSMGYDDMKVIEASIFLRSVIDGVQREPGLNEIASAARVIDAMVRSCESGSWEEVRRA